MTKIKRLAVGILPTLCLVMVLAVFTPTLNICVYASSWIQDTDEYEQFYSSAITTQTPDQVEQDDENFLIKLLGTFIHFIGADTANDLSTDQINLTIDGVVLGRLAQPGGVSYTSFDLSAGNVYGTVGATVYTVFRGFAYSGMFLVFLYLLAMAVFGSTPKSREELKQGIYALAINYTLIYLMPQITDIVIFLRDNLLYFVMQHLSNDVSILNAMDDLYKADKSLIKAIVYTATVFASLFYIKDYVSIAIQETVLFGFFCLFTVLGTVKKKYLTDWCATFFSNLLVPLIDVVCLMLPYTALKLLDTGQGRMSFGAACVVVMMIWSARTTRKELLRLFGSVTNTSAGRGIAGLAHMAQMARMAHAATRGRNNNTGGKGNMDTYNDWTDEADRQRTSAASMYQQGSEISKGLGSEFEDLDYYESRYGSMDTDTGIDEGQYMHACDDYVDAQQQENAYEITQDSISDEQGGMDESPAPGGEPQAVTDLSEVPQEDAAGDTLDVPDYYTASGIAADVADNEPGDSENESPKVIPEEADGEDGRDTVVPSVGASGGHGEITGEGMPLRYEKENAEIPDMTDFEKNRYRNLQQMDMAEDSLSATRKDIDRWNREIAMMDSSLQDARDDALAESEGDRQEIARLGKDNASLDLLIQENDADNRQISTLQDQNKEIDKEISDERKSLKGTGTDTNARIESLEKQRDENSQKIADLHTGIDARNQGWAEQADAMENRKIDSWQKENDQIDRDIAAIKQEGGAGDSGRMRMEELSAQKAANAHNIAQAQSRIDRRSGDLRLEKARNSHAMTEAQTRIDARNDALGRHVEDINRKKLDNRQNIAQAQARIGNISAQLDSRRKAEEQFASISKSNGKDGRKYLSAEEMRMHVDQRNKRLEGLMAAAEKRGAISQDMLRDLSPEGAARVAEIQREAIRQSNLRHAMAKLAGGTAKAAAITAGAAVGSVVTMYGGEDASATGAMLGAMGTGGIVNAVVGTARTVTQNREEIITDMEAGKKKVSAASAFYEQSRGGHSQGEKQTAFHGPNRRVNKARPPHEQVYAETLEALERNGRMEVQMEGQVPDGRPAHEKVSDETIDAIRRRGGRSD